MLGDSRDHLHSLTRALRKERPTKPKFVLVPEERVRFQRTGLNKPRACVVSKVSDDGGEALRKVPWADEVDDGITETEQKKEKAPLDTHWHDELDLEPEPEEGRDGEALKAAALAVDASAVCPSFPSKQCSWCLAKANGERQTSGGELASWNTSDEMAIARV